MDVTTSQIKKFSYPKLYKGKDWYIGFNAYDPATGKMRRKRMKINSVGDKAREKYEYAKGIINRISQQLDSGWNPWIEQSSNGSFHLLADVEERYKNYVNKLLSDGSMRQHTQRDYLCKLNMMNKFNAQRRVPITYIYQLDRHFCNEFLDYIYIDLQNSPRTRNNYLLWLSELSGWLVQREYLKKRPIEGIQRMPKVNREKDRDVISDEDMKKLHDYLNERNKNYLLACYFLHYILIRPKEMSYIRLSDINLQRQTIYIHGTWSKNKKDAVVTLPVHVINLMIDLNIFQYPSEYFLFSDKFIPGKKRKTEKQFRDYWSYYIRRDLHFSERYKFYSLKDTGITNMLRSCDVISVRDQARHSSILMTDIYTPADIRESNKILLNYQGIL